MRKLQTNKIDANMKKYILSLLIFLFLFLFLFLFFYYQINKTDNPFLCDSQLISKLEIDDKSVEINLYAKNLIYIDSESTMSLTGSIAVNNSEYVVNRKIKFVLNKTSLHDLYTTKIIKDEKQKNDDVSDSVWHRYFLSTPLNTQFNTEIIKLNNNAIFLKELANPIFICTQME